LTWRGLVSEVSQVTDLRDPVHHPDSEQWVATCVAHTRAFLILVRMGYCTVEGVPSLERREMCGASERVISFVGYCSSFLAVATPLPIDPWGAPGSFYSGEAGEGPGASKLKGSGWWAGGVATGSVVCSICERLIAGPRGMINWNVRYLQSADAGSTGPPVVRV